MRFLQPTSCLSTHVIEGKLLTHISVHLQPLINKLTTLYDSFSTHKMGSILTILETNHKFEEILSFSCIYGAFEKKSDNTSYLAC